MDEMAKFLSLSELFKDISPQELTEISVILKEVSYPENTRIFHEDDLGDNLYLLKEGSVKISLKASFQPDDEEMIQIVRPGEIFGEFSFIDGSRRSASAVSLDASTAFIMTRPDFNEFSIQKPSVALSVMHNFAWILTQKIRNTNMLWRSSQILYDE